jgi:hypothetical protein
MREEDERRDRRWRQLRIDSVNIDTGESFVEPLARLFHKRELRR